MIRIKSKAGSDHVELEIKAEGLADDIINEAVAVMVGLPEKLASELPRDAFGVFSKTMSHALRTRIDELEVKTNAVN